MTALIIIICVIALYLIASYAIFRYAFVRRREKASEDSSASWAVYRNEIAEGIAWIKAKNCEKIELVSCDGLRLAARLLPVENPRGTLILFHGYRSAMFRDFAGVYRFYNGLGYNLLIPCQRAHGESEGKYICFGVKERYDCQSWAKYAAERFGADHDIFLSGLSMGASTVLMASDLELPENIRGIIADCGFTSAWDELSYLLEAKIHLPPHPFLDGVNLFCRLFAGFSMRGCSTTDCVARTKLPVLFVHGDSDDFVPSRFTLENYAACAGEKELVLVKGATHGVSYLVDTEGCQKKLKEFFERYSKCGI